MEMERKGYMECTNKIKIQDVGGVDLIKNINLAFSIGLIIKTWENKCGNSIQIRTILIAAFYKWFY